MSGRRIGVVPGSIAEVTDIPSRTFFADPAPEPSRGSEIAVGMHRLAEIAPHLHAIARHFGHQDTPVGRALYLDAAAALLAEADRAWSTGRVLEALAFEGLEARLIEVLVCP